MEVKTPPSKTKENKKRPEPQQPSLGLVCDGVGGSKSFLWSDQSKSKIVFENLGIFALQAKKEMDPAYVCSSKANFVLPNIDHTVFTTPGRQ